MSKITIFHINGTEIFSHECEGNTIAITVEEAVKQGVILTHADLSYANLSGVIIENETLTKNPITKYLKWSVLITEKFMRIGCQRHTHSEWENFSEEEISQMAEGASEFWKEHKEELIGLCKVHAQSV